MSYDDEHYSYSETADAVSCYTYNNDNVHDNFVHIFNGMLVKLYDNKGRCSYLLSAGGAEECSFVPETNIDHMVGSLLTVTSQVGFN